MLTVGQVTAGTKSNIIPDRAIIELNIRAYSENTRTLMISAIKRIVNGASAFASWRSGAAGDCPSRA